ncbi:ABC-type multidrug transport system ATPase subunit [Arthrobacter roseus]|nr:ABC-type multidrug transport system ATPase subunit [Arthrobacter roseus]
MTSYQNHAGGYRPENLLRRIDAVGGWHLQIQDTNLRLVFDGQRDGVVPVSGTRHHLHVWFQVKQLSGGQRRRLDLILATINQPEILFLDEPTTGLDPESRERTWAVVRAMHDAGTTVVLTTHYLEEAETLADRIAIMHEGNIAVSGSLPEVLGAEPASIRFVLDPAVHVEGLTASGVDASFLPMPTETRVTIATDHLQRDLSRALTWAEAGSIRLERLSASEASLAEVFRRVSAGGSGHTNQKENNS